MTDGGLYCNEIVIDLTFFVTLGMCIGHVISAYEQKERVQRN